MNKKGFTLVELLAVLTILAIISLITIPILVGTINNSKEQTYIKSIVSYGKAVENAIETKRAETKTVAKTIEELKEYIKTSGNTVVCNNEIKESENGGIVLRYCKVVNDQGEQLTETKYRYENGKVTEEEIKNEEQADDVETAIESYKAAIQYAVSYKLINGERPQSINEMATESVIKLNLFPNGLTVKCNDEIDYITEDGVEKIVLNNCRVLYGDDQLLVISKIKLSVVTIKEYSVGDKLTIHDEEYYVISDQGSYVTLLKENPLTVEEVNKYGEVGTANNHVNKFAGEKQTTAYNWNNTGYGSMAYYSSTTCGYQGVTYVDSGCQSENATSYDTSDVKYVVDAWMNDKFNRNELAIDTNGYQARLINREELESLGYDSIIGETTANSNVPTFLYNDSYWYWTMIPIDNNTYDRIYYMGTNGTVGYTEARLNIGRGLVRPVINVYKSKL